MVEGTIGGVLDDRTLERLAAMWKDKLDWAFEVGDGVFLDTEPGHTALVFAVTPSKILAFRKDPYSQTRYVL